MTHICGFMLIPSLYLFLLPRFYAWVRITALVYVGSSYTYLMLSNTMKTIVRVHVYEVSLGYSLIIQEDCIDGKLKLNKIVFKRKIKLHMKWSTLHINI